MDTIDSTTEKSEKKYTFSYHVHRNDLKYKHMRCIDPSRAIWNDDVKEDFYNKNTDDIEYRIEEFIREKYQLLDLSYMDDKCFDLLQRHKMFDKVKKNVLYIFAQNSDLSVVPDLDNFEKLLVLDLADNKITKLPKLPITIEELILTNNELECIDHNMPNLKRLKINNNEIKELKYCDKLESLYANNNPINKIPTMNELYYLNISSTKIKFIKSYPKLKYLDCSHSDISTIPAMDSLLTCICNYSSVNNISELKNLEILEMIESGISCVHYMDNLHSLKYNKDMKFKISKKYKIYGILKNKCDIIETVFKT